MPDETADPLTEEVLDLGDLDPADWDDFAEAQGWSDGLPLVMPTESAVAKFVAAAGGDNEPFPIIPYAIHPHQGSGAHEIPIHVRIIIERKGGEGLVSQGADREPEDPGTQRQDEREPRQGSEQARYHRFPDGEQTGSDGPVIATPAA